MLLLDDNVWCSPAFVLALLFSLTSYRTLAQSADSPPRLTIDLAKPFRLTTIVNVEQDNSRRFGYHFEETYSSNQGRTRISYETQVGSLSDAWLEQEQLPASGNLIVGGPSIFLLPDKGRPASSGCRELTHGSLKRLLSLQAIDLIDPTISDQDNGLHGLSLVLHLVERFRDKLKRVNMPNPSVRNVPSNMFGYMTDRFQLLCFHSLDQTTGGSGLPLRVILDMPDGYHVEYDFLHYGERADESQDMKHHEGLGDQFDEFFIGRATGCSAHATAILGNEGHLLVGSDIRRSFSFTARVPESFQHAHAELSRVAFLGDLNVMRVQSESESRSSSLLIDYNLGTTHHVLERKDGRQLDATIDQILVPTFFGEDESRSCVMVESVRKESPDVIQLLTGAPSRFILLGQARARGRRVRAYEAYNTTWPSWLEQPVKYTLEGAAPALANKIREAYHGNLQAGVVLTTVVYLGENDDRLVQMEIFRLYHETKRVLSQVTIPVHDFTWLPGQVVDLASLSLIDKCPGESEQHGRVAMLLTNSNLNGLKLKESWLHDNHLRDLSLLATIQGHLQIPSPMIGQLNSKLVTTENPRQTSTLEVTFEFGSSARRSVARLVHHGAGQVKKLFQFKLMKLEHASLKTCFYLTAHRKRDTFFAHSQRDSLCLVDLGPSPTIPNPDSLDPRAVLPKAFDLSDRGANSMDIYFVRHDEEANPSYLLAQLYTGQSQQSPTRISNSQLMKRLVLRGPHGSENADAVEQFNVNSFEFLDLNNDQQPFEVDDVALVKTEKFLNFALVPDGKVTRALEQQVPDLEGCRAACLSSLGCKSYSLCWLGSSLECSLASVDFKPGSSLLLQLVDIEQHHPLRSLPVGYRERSIHTLRVNETNTVQVQRRPNCELHNKLYLNLFHKSLRRQNLGEFGSLEPVGGRDQCARRCFKATLKVMSESDDVLAATKTELEQLTRRTENLEGAKQTVVSIITAQRSAAKKACKEFYYLDAINLASLDRDLREQYHLLPQENTNDDPPQGYCSIMRHPDDRPTTPHNRKATLELERYAFKFEALYEKKKSVRLLASKRSQAELDAYQSLMSRQVQSNGLELEPLLGIINDSKNAQSNMMMSHMDETTCATICATQVMGPWPACRSFDLIVISSARDESRAVCLMNSITLQDALDTGQHHLIDYSSSQSHMHWHYEPRFSSRYGYISNEHQTDQSFSVSSELFMARQSVYFRLRSTKILGICMIGLVTGILLGLNLGHKYSRSQRESRCLLNDLTSETDQNFTLSIEVGSGRSGVDLSHK